MSPDDVLALLLPVERVSLTVAAAQIRRGEDPSENVALVCAGALARITGLADWTKEVT